MHATKHASEGFTLPLKPRGDITRSPKQGYQWPHKKDSCPPKNFKKRPVKVPEYQESDVTSAFARFAWSAYSGMKTHSPFKAIIAFAFAFTRCE